MREAVKRIAHAGGFLPYLRQEGRGIGPNAKLDAHALQDAGVDTCQARAGRGRRLVHSSSADLVQRHARSRRHAARQRREAPTPLARRPADLKRATSGPRGDRNG